MEILSRILAVLMYMVVGGIISAPYTYLANGNVFNFVMTAAWAPIVALAVFTFIYVALRMCDAGRIERHSLWVVGAYACLPILMNGASHLLDLFGFEVVARYVFEYRYTSLLAVPLTIMLCLGVTAAVVEAWQRLRGTGKPPSSAPPTGGSSPHEAGASLPGVERRNDPSVHRLFPA